MTEEERITDLEQRAEKQDGKIKTVGEAIVALSQSVLHHSEMMDDFFRGMNELRAAQADTDVKVAALVDAQIRAEDEMKELRGVIKQMAQAIIKTSERVDDLEKS